MTGVLLKAVTAGRPRQVRLLLDSGIRLDTVDECGQTALMRAIFLEHRPSRETIVKILLGVAINMTSCDVVGRTALSWACIYGRDREVGWILQHADVDLNLSDVNGQTALAHAAITGNAATVKLLVDDLLRFSLSVEVPDKKGMTPLMHAIRQCHDVCASILLYQGGATVGKDMKSPADVDYAVKFWAEGYSDSHERTRHFLDLDPRDYNNNSGVNTSETKTKVRKQHRNAYSSYFPPILHKSCAETIKYRETFAKRHQIHTFDPDLEGPLSIYDSEKSSLWGDSLENCGESSGCDGSIGPIRRVSQHWSKDPHTSIPSPSQSPVTYRTTSMTSSTEVHAESSDEDDVDDRSRPVCVNKRLFQSSIDMHQMFRVYEQQNSQSYRPGAARSVLRARLDEGSEDGYVESSSENSDNVKDNTSNVQQPSRRHQPRCKVTVSKRSMEINSSSDSDLSDKLFAPARRGLLPKIPTKSCRGN